MACQTQNDRFLLGEVLLPWDRTGKKKAPQNLGNGRACGWDRLSATCRS